MPIEPIEPVEPQRLPRIAVVAIHGVGDHNLFDTAREIGDLLSDLTYEPAGTPRYGAFRETYQRVNVRPVKVLPLFGSAQDETPGRTAPPLEAIARAAYDGTAQLPIELNRLYMESQLAEYQGERPEDTYELLCLEGRRISPPPGPVDPDEAGKATRGIHDLGVTMPQDEKRLREGTGSPTAAPGPQERVVHIYDMYWADLSNLGNAFTRIFIELYQLMFQLATVGVNNVKAAAIHFQPEPGKDMTPGARRWRWFDWWQTSAAWTLAVPVPLFNLLMMSMVLPLLAVSEMRRHLNSFHEFVALLALVSILCTAFVGQRLMASGRLKGTRSKPSPLFVIPPALVLLLLGTAAALGWKGYIPDREITEDIFASIVGIVDIAAVVFLMRASARTRPRAVPNTWYGSLAVILAGIALWFVPRFTFFQAQQYQAIVAGMNLIELGIYLLTAVWIFFGVAALMAHFAGWLAVKATAKASSQPKHLDPSRRTKWTARLLLALPASSLTVLILLAWAGISYLCIPLLPGDESVPPSPIGSAKQVHPTAACHADCNSVLYKPLLFTPDPKVKVEWHPVEIWIRDKALQDSGMILMPIVLGAMLLAIVIVVWGLVPVVWNEVFPPDNSIAGDLSVKSASLGNWLTNGFALMHASGSILYLTMFVPLALVVYRFLVWRFGFPGIPFAESSWNIAKVAGALVVGTAVGVLGFSGRLKSIALGFRPVVRVMLDVDNWLREYPRDSNPTARICGRYASVLRHIVAWRDPMHSGRCYDAVVIIAHSQGTVITADLLRFLKAKRDDAKRMGALDNEPGHVYDPELEALGSDKLPVYLFTMGCPLRQLYGLRFPFLFGWGYGAAVTATPDAEPSLLPDSSPDPAELGVKQWVNAFRSGDYVGRNLWRSDVDLNLWSPIEASVHRDWDPKARKPSMLSANETGTRVEFCIGPGAHTHYWDHTGELIAQVLDRIINAA